MSDKRRATHTVDTPKNEIEWLPCGVCKRETRHSVLATVSENDVSPDAGIFVFDEYSVVRCGGCHNLSFRVKSECSEYEQEWDEEAQQYVITPIVTLYPSRLAGRALLADARHLPSPVQEIYREAFAAQCNRLPLLSGLGVRTIVEAVCSEKGIAGRDLYSKIENLAKAGHITLDGARVLHSLRFMGNRAAHDMVAPSEQELEAAFDVIEYLLNGVYNIPRRAQSLPQP